MDDVKKTPQLEPGIMLGETAPLTQLDDGTWFPERTQAFAFFRGSVQWPVLSFVLEVEARQVVLTRFSVERQRTTGPGSWPDGESVGPEVTASFIHGLNVGAILEQVIRRVAEFSLSFTRLDQPMPRITPEEARTVGERALATRQYRRVDDALLRQVADIAAVTTYNLRGQVSERLHTSERTASRWIAEARERGFITEEEDK
ncbi:MAG: hypothetical protein ACLPSM_09745 [Acidimicrobiales bacterium]|jgi:hypothetical protein